MASKLLEIRKVTESARHNIHEKLRGNHIETLEQLEIVTDENQSLRQELLDLKKKPGVNLKDENYDKDVDETNRDDTSDLLRTVISLKDEVKSLKSRLLQAEGESKDFKKASNLLRQEEFSYRKKLELERAEAEAEALDVCNTRVASYEAIALHLQEVQLENEKKHMILQRNGSKLSEDAISDIRLQLSHCEAEIINLKESNLRLVTHSKEYQTVITLSEKEKDGLSEQLVENRSRSFTLLADFTFLKDEMDGIRSSHLILESENTFLKDEMDSMRFSHSTLQSENLIHLSHILKLEADIKRQKEENRSMKVEGMNNETHSTSFLTENPATLRAISGLENGGGEYRIGKGGFEEFVLLKKENKTLKLQIAHLQTKSKRSSI